MRRTGEALLSAAGIVTALLGVELATATAEPSDEQLIRIAIRNVPETCQALRNLPTAQGVRGAIADVMGQTELPRSAAARVVGHAVRLSCPHYLPLVQQVVPGFP